MFWLEFQEWMISAAREEGGVFQDEERGHAKVWRYKQGMGETMDVEEEGEATGSGGPKFGGALSALVKLGGFIT